MPPYPSLTLLILSSDGGGAKAVGKVLAMNKALIQYLSNPDEYSSTPPSLGDIDDNTTAPLADGQRYADFNPDTGDIGQVPIELRHGLYDLTISHNQVKVLQTNNEWMQSYILTLHSDRLKTIDGATTEKLLAFFQSPAP